ncbi:MAG: 6-phospho-3-hexuloisomerase [Kosmotogaceae bacterium]
MKFEKLFNNVLSEIKTTLSKINDDSIESFSRKILDAKRIFLFAMGRSGLVIKAFAMRLMHLGLNVHVVGEVTTPALGKGDLLIVGSASGETDSVVINCKKAKELGAEVVSITASNDSSVANQSNVIILIPTTTPKVPERKGISSVQPMGNLFEQSMLIVTDIIIMNLMEKLNIDSSDMYKNHVNIE